MESIKPRITFKDLFGYFLAYLAWFATATASIASILLFRNAFNVLWAALGLLRTNSNDPYWAWLLRPVDRFGLIIGGLVWLGFVIFCEQHYRHSISVKREQRFRTNTDHLYAPPPPPENKAMFFLHRLGLDILMRRFLTTFVIPLIILALSWLMIQIAGWIIG